MREVFVNAATLVCSEHADIAGSMHSPDCLAIAVSDRLGRAETIRIRVSEAFWKEILTAPIAEYKQIAKDLVETEVSERILAIIELSEDKRELEAA